MVRSRWRRWAWPSELRRRGILAINRRNAEYVLPRNPRSQLPGADDKLRTKRLCQEHGVPVPATYAVVTGQAQVRRALLACPHQDFVVKPARGSRGRGILVVTGRRDGLLTTPAGETISPAEFRHHLSAVLAGFYSREGEPDRAMIEARVVPHPLFRQVAPEGAPDIRVIVYRNQPVMAMVRLPTRASRGRANLHQGAVGVGVDLPSGVTFGGVWQGRSADLHPDTGQPIAGLTIPHWHDLLRLARRVGQVLQLGYLGADFVLDAERGPVLLEANARPGLAIQLANRCGLLPRLWRIDGKTAAPSSDMHLSGWPVPIDSG